MTAPPSPARRGDAGMRPAFRPDRVYLGWQHALTDPEPGPMPARPAAPAVRPVSPAWLAAQRAEEDRLARPPKLAAACAAAAACALGGAWLAGLLTTGLAVLGGSACLVTGAVSARSVWRGERQLRALLAAETVRVRGFAAAAQRQGAAREAGHAGQVRAWRHAVAAFRRQPQWYPVSLPGGVHRVDVAGGTLAGWSALLTSMAVPRLAAGGEVTVLDLTEGAVAGDLLSLARACGMDPLVWALPADLPQLDLGAGLAADALADVLAMTVSGGEDQAAPGDPARDAALLRRVLGVLPDGAGIGQVAAALRALAQVGDPRADVRAGLLTSAELDRLSGLFGRGATERIVIDRAWAMEARLRVLAELATAPAALAPSRLRLAGLDRRSGAVGNKILATYLTVALTHVLRQAPAGRPWQQTLFVLGAETLRADVLDRLTDACEVSRTGLVIGYRSIPAPVRDRLGRGHAAVAFMRLGNAQDARVAAEQIGTEHRFVISQLTQTVGTSVTSTTGDSYTSTVGTADSVTGSVSVSDTTGRSRGRGSTHAGLFAPLGEVSGSASRDSSTSRALSDSVSLTEGINSSTSWGWSTSRAVGENDSLARGSQRSREFLVEASELQQLPDSAVLLTYAGPGGRRVVLADANPAIIGLPTTSLLSLEEVAARSRAGPPS